MAILTFVMMMLFLRNASDIGTGYWCIYTSYNHFTLLSFKMPSNMNLIGNMSISPSCKNDCNHES